MRVLLLIPFRAVFVLVRILAWTIMGAWWGVQTGGNVALWCILAPIVVELLIARGRAARWGATRR